MYEKAHKEKVFDEIFKSISINNDIKSLKGRLPKRCFTYETLKNSRVSNETTFSAHKCPTKSYKFPAKLHFHWTLIVLVFLQTQNLGIKLGTKTLFCIEVLEFLFITCSTISVRSRFHDFTLIC